MQERHSKQSQSASYRPVSVAEGSQPEAASTSGASNIADSPIPAIKLSSGSVKVTDADDEV